MIARPQPAAFAPLLRCIASSTIPRISPLSFSRASSRTPAPIFSLLPIRRFAHSIPQPPSSSSPEDPAKEDNGEKAELTRKQKQPHYQLTFTCAPCDTRSSHTISKQGYHHGSVLITCPECRNRHVISDHLGIFGDRKITIEDIMREKGQLVKRGTLGEDGDVEFWEDEKPSAASQA